jgi:hypothetical protein
MALVRTAALLLIFVLGVGADGEAASTRRSHGAGTPTLTGHTGHLISAAAGALHLGRLAKSTAKQPREPWYAIAASFPTAYESFPRLTLLLGLS